MLLTLKAALVMQELFKYILHHILGIGRAIGETMAVVMVAGNQTWMPKGLFQGLRTMTSNIVIEMGYAADLHREALIATGVVLFVFILLINLCFSLVKGGKDYA